MISSAISSDLAIDLRHVTRFYRGRVHALQGIDMQVGRGEVFGFSAQTVQASPRLSKSS